MSNSLSIDGFGPLPVVRPTSIAELSDLVHAAAADGKALYPVGGGTMLDLGLPPTKPGTVVEVGALDRVIDYPARDMTITVQAGITVARLQETLRAEGQQLPVDIPFPDRATIGGAVATNASGPRRLGYGTLRDYVIGISVMNDDGEEIKGGGRVVKNVAGYDLMKLYTGSLGTLGIITQLTLKVRPLPERAHWSVITCEPDDVSELINQIRASATRPCAITVRGIAKQGSVATAGIVVEYEDNARAVEWQVNRLREELPERFRDRLLPLGQVVDSLLAAVRDFPLSAQSEVTFKANVLPARTWEFCVLAAKGSDLSFQAHAGNGIIVGHIAETNPDAARTYLNDLIRFAGECSGNVVTTRCPSVWKSVVPVWGRSTPDRELMKAVKDKLDPRRVFNPGRFVDGI